MDYKVINSTLPPTAALPTGKCTLDGIMGITTFRPELLLDNPYTPPVVITKLQLFNKTVRPDR